MYLSVLVDKPLNGNKYIVIRSYGDYGETLGCIEDEVYITKEILQEVLGIKGSGEI